MTFGREVRGRGRLVCISEIFFSLWDLEELAGTGVATRVAEA